MSRNIIISVLLIISCYGLGAQTTNTQIEKYLLLKQKAISPDQLFVHLDKNKYKPGDTIYFQAYIRDRFTNEFVSRSVSLYALLFDDKNIKVDSSRFKIDHSTCSGWMSIPLKSTSGKYHFVAFTSIMQNFEPSKAFMTDLFIGGEDKIVGEIGKPVNSKCFELRFLPEGGNSVQGLEQRIGFNATDSKGNPIYIEGLLKNSSGLTLDTITSGTYGPGFFVCTPEPGMYVEIIKGNIKEKIWQLPNPMVSGICLSVKSINNRSFSVEIQSNNYKNDTLTVVGVMNVNLVFFQKLIVKNNKQRFIIETDQLPSGVAQITVFSKDLHPLAERLFYVNADKHLNFNIDTKSGICKIGQETELEISIYDGLGKPIPGIFSISVTDSISGWTADINTPGIESVLNLNPYFQTTLPRKVIETGLENLTNNERDLMLMIYGWEKYNWDFSDNVTTTQDLINYDLINLKIEGESKIHPSMKELDLISLEDPIVIHLKTNKMGEISLLLDSLPNNVRSITLLPGKNGNNRIMGVMWNIPYNEQFLKDVSLFISQQTVGPSKKADTYSLNMSVLSDKSNVSDLNNQGITDKTFEIPGVTITATKKKEYLNKYEEIYKYANVKSLPGEQINKYITLGQAIRNMILSATIYEPPFPPAIYFRQSHSFYGARIKVLIVLDGMRLFDGWSEVRTLPTNQISSITILNGPQGHTIYGEDGSGGVIFITTNRSSLAHIRTDWKSQNKSKNLLTPINIFRQNVEFYSPSRSEIEDNAIISDRTTIYWNPEVYYNGKDPVKIKYLNLKNIGPVLITINGVSINNLIGAGRASYQVR